MVILQNLLVVIYYVITENEQQKNFTITAEQTFKQFPLDISSSIEKLEVFVPGMFKNDSIVSLNNNKKIKVIFE